MNWTTPAQIKARIQRLWDNGSLLEERVYGESQFPLRLVLKQPRSAELADSFGEVQAWIGVLARGQAGHYRIESRKVRHRIIGENELPAAIWIDSREQALALIGKQGEARRFDAVVAETRTRVPEILPWVGRNSLKAWSLAEVWPRLLDITLWLRAHPRPGIYLRQVDLPGIHSKFIEDYRAVLAQLLDLALPPDAILATATGVAGFASRYGFREKPLRVRFRMLDPRLSLIPGGVDQDLALNSGAFARLTLPLRRVFITENEINFLAFPAAPDSIVLFGSGYGFDTLADALWLGQCSVHYWGDIDTHGFAILDQLRARLPHARSFLMDRDTLLDHRNFWDREPQPERRDLPRLTADEAALYDDLRCNRLADQLRLEQERVSYARVELALASVVGQS